jgi:hypothetical protein
LINSYLMPGRRNGGANSYAGFWDMEQTDLLRFAADTLERMNVPYLVVGSVACIAYGESRFTHDIDIVAELSPEHVADLALQRGFMDSR